MDIILFSFDDMVTTVNTVVLNSLSDTFRKFLSSFFNKKKIYQTSDSIILQLYYKYTVYFILFFYVNIQYTMYYTDHIRCVNSIRGDTNAQKHHLNYCLSYSRHPKTDEFVAYYKWIPWTLIGFVVYFYLVKKVMKFCHCGKVSGTEDQDTKGIDKCFYYHILAHVVALSMNAFSFFIINFSLQNIFWDLVPVSYPFKRDFDTFQDPLSTRFSPFTVCTIDQRMLYGSVVEYRCHLIFMEYYEKFFVLLWLWLVILGILNFFYIVILCVRLVRCSCSSEKSTLGGRFLQIHQRR